MSAVADMGWLLDPLDELTTQYSDLFVQAGKDELISFGIIILVFYAFRHGLHGGILRFLMQFGLLFLIAANLLQYYNAPIPGASFSVHQAFQVFATGLADQIDLKRMDLLFSNVATILSHLERPSITDIDGILVHFLIEIVMWVIQAALYVVTAMSFLALGIGSLLGPILIPTIIIPKLSQMFWNWIQFMLQYSFYRVGAAALVFVASTALNTFFTRTLHTSVCGIDQSCYDLAQMLIIFPKMLVFVAAVLAGILKLGSMMSDLFKGSSMAGANMASTVAGAMRGNLG